MEWTPLARQPRDGLAASVGEFITRHGQLVTGTYGSALLERDTDRLSIYTDGPTVLGVAAVSRLHHTDPEIATACGRIAITIPLLITAPELPLAVVCHMVEQLAAASREKHGPHRVTVHQPAGRRPLNLALQRAGFRADSALSIAAINQVPHNRRLVGTTAVRPATAADAVEIGRIFRESLHTLTRLSPYVVFDEAAVSSIVARMGTCEGGRTAAGTYVDVATDPRGSLLGVCEYSWSRSPSDRLTLLPSSLNGCVHWIGVTDRHRGRGVGHELVSHAAAMMRQQEARTLYAYHLIGENTAERFWCRVGLSRAWATWEL